jgi:plasmid maintenance system killer protein
MEVLFDDKNLADSRKRKGKFTKAHKQINHRIEQLISVESLAHFEKDYPGVRCHEYDGKYKGTFTIDISGNWRLHFRLTESQEGCIDKNKVTSITIIEILDPH